MNLEELRALEETRNAVARLTESSLWKEICETKTGVAIKSSVRESFLSGFIPAICLVTKTDKDRIRVTEKFGDRIPEVLNLPMFSVFEIVHIGQLID